ncbi:cytosine/adenosine deaminase-related metal-dependent hydrolase [Scopulibacillus darangshiensis]|uniref:Cytosine/adenosine deaminase-related metal-dependent hydrolase n=1 Tax=Scopulibacillus darangshiensis TaxID=442528 RepID=A0A4R2NQL7_9BACL|nr:amidohydrolase family protein [Scopulibacillus darangshiensis]TCP23751.1 cytosine/adenosine deaminase-related metal-dependent hydrolase [Scopulibacillus darangshiensis]
MENYWLTNVRLETGFTYEDGIATGTKTGLFHLKIEDGEIKDIVSSDTALPSEASTQDAGSLLALPNFAEMHIHIDKTYYGGTWKAPTPFKNIFTRINEEQKLLPKLLPTAKERAEKILELELQNGTTFVRTHCNIDQVVGLKNLEATMLALESYKDKMEAEIVAFPQHGLLRSHSVQLVKEAMRSGANLVGSVDPATVDNNIEKSLTTLMDIAVEFDAGIDFHLHDSGQLGTYTMKRLADLTEEAGWHNRVTVSHALGLGDVSEKDAAEIAERFANLGISITSTVPVRQAVIPIPLLHEKSVRVMLGNDTIIDHWNPFGTGDMLVKANTLAQRFHWIHEQALAKALGFVTNGSTPLDENGNQAWPKIGDPANLTLVEASCSAEAVARVSNRHAVIYRGNTVAGTLTS